MKQQTLLSFFGKKKRSTDKENSAPKRAKPAAAEEAAASAPEAVLQETTTPAAAHDAPMTEATASAQEEPKAAPDATEAEAPPAEEEAAAPPAEAKEPPAPAEAEEPPAPAEAEETEAPTSPPPANPQHAGLSQYEIELEAGLRLAKITNLADDLAIALRVPSVRIVAPIPGKNSVGVEVPNTDRQMVRLREVMEETHAKSRSMKIPIYLGKDVGGNPMAVDLATMPHLLIAGRTGTGKSVCLNSIIVSMLMTRRPDEVRMLMIDPKMVELTPYKSLPHLMHPVAVSYTHLTLPTKA